MLPRPAAGPRRRERLRRHLARAPPPARPYPGRQLHRPRRDLPPAHRDQPSPGRHPRAARYQPTPEDLPAHPGHEPLTSRNTPTRYTPSTQERAHSRTSNPRSADQHATQLRNPGRNADLTTTRHTGWRRRAWRREAPPAQPPRAPRGARRRFPHPGRGRVRHGCREGQPVCPAVP